MLPQSALVVPVPEAEPLVNSYRTRFDPSAASGMPAHVTILFPFVAPDLVDDEVVSKVRAVLSASAPFSAHFRVTGNFPDVLYLAPEPVESFRNLTLSVWSAFPETPPYGGAFAEIMPHLTVVHSNDARILEASADAVSVALQAAPVRAEVHEVVLFEDSTGRWEPRERFTLGTAFTTT